MRSLKINCHLFIPHQATETRKRLQETVSSNPAHRRRAERLPCRHRQAGAGAHGKAHRADEAAAGYHRVVDKEKSLSLSFLQTIHCYCSVERL